MASTQRRVVITGVGVICPLGSSLGDLWESLSNGRGGIGPMTALPSDAFPMSFAAEARQFEGKIGDFGGLEKEQKKSIRKALKVMCRECQMGVAVSHLAMFDAKMVGCGCDPDRIGVSFGTDYMLTVPGEFVEGINDSLNEQGEFEFARWPIKGLQRMSPLWLLKYLPNMPASHMSIFNDFRGPNNSHTLREASPGTVISEALGMIGSGRADIMLVGTTGTRLHPMKTIHSILQEELAADPIEPGRASRPFDRDRSGMVLGEGAAAMVLEELSLAEARGAKIYGEVAGGASSAVAGKNLVARRDVAMKNAMEHALLQAGVGPDDVGHVHAHGLSTRSCDVEESLAIGQVFGDRNVPVVAAKSYFGNLGAAGGMVEIASSLLAMEHDSLFPVLNYETSDPECPVSVVVDHGMKPGDSFINVNVTPQGQASASLIRRFV